MADGSTSRTLIPSGTAEALSNGKAESGATAPPRAREEVMARGGDFVCWRAIGVSARGCECFPFEFEFSGRYEPPRDGGAGPCATSERLCIGMPQYSNSHGIDRRVTSPVSLGIASPG